jgi:hypothetical protein
MRHSSGKRSSPSTFRGFGFVIAAILAGYLGLIGSLGWGIQQTLVRDHVEVAQTSQAPSDAPVGASIVRANVAQ